MPAEWKAKRSNKDYVVNLKNRLNNNRLTREISLFSATVLVIANMVGTGIFTTSGFIIEELGDPKVMLLCWFVGGIFALTGALCYGELGALFPEAGGEYVFLRESFGKAVAFLSGWISLIVGFSAPIAAAAIAFGTYFFRMFPVRGNSDYTASLFDITIFTISPVTILAVIAILIFSFVHYHSLAFGTKVQNGLTVFKIGLILVFIVGGLWMGEGSVEHFSGDLSAGSIFNGKFAVSLIFVSFAYSGWNAAAYLGGEIKEPSRNLPLALLGGTLIVMALYMGLNAVFIYALSPEKMSGVLEVGTQSAISLFGKGVSKYFSGAIALGLLSVLSAMIMAGPRVYYAMAKDRVFFELFGKVNKFHKTPARAIFLQAFIAICMAITASFDELLIYIGFTLALCAVLTVCGMVKLRMTRFRTRDSRQYSTPGYPVTPLLFVLGNLWIVYFSIRSRPAASLCGLLTIGIGILIFFYFNKRMKRSREA